MIDLAHLWTAITPTTVLSTTAVAVVLAAHLWHTLPRVTVPILVAIWLGALMFIVICAGARWTDGSGMWETYLGISVLWTWSIGVTAASVVVWRRVRRRLGR